MLCYNDAVMYMKILHDNDGFLQTILLHFHPIKIHFRYVCSSEATFLDNVQTFPVQYQRVKIFLILCKANTKMM